MIVTNNSELHFIHSRSHPLSSHRTDKLQVSFDEFLSIMNRVPLHEDPTQKLKDAFSIFDQCARHTSSIPHKSAFS